MARGDEAPDFGARGAGLARVRDIDSIMIIPIHIEEIPDATFL